VRRRTPGWDGASAIDAAIVVVSAAYLVLAADRALHAA
jgi:hypothetical protein